MMKFIGAIKHSTATTLFTCSLFLTGILFLTSPLHAVTRPKPTVEYLSRHRQITLLEASKNKLLARIENAQVEVQLIFMLMQDLKQGVSANENHLAKTEQDLQKPMPPEEQAQRTALVEQLRKNIEYGRKVLENNRVFINITTQQIEAMQEEVRRIEGEIARLRWQRL
jgi:hypothetical protein